MTADLLAGVELGGTKCVCLLGSGPGDIRSTERIPTEDPQTTLAAIERVLVGWQASHPSVKALGIASFGPIELDRAHPMYGAITQTSKPGWSGSNVAVRLARATGLPTGFDTDVNGAALAEGQWGACQGLKDHVYVTVGTGIGVGVVTAGHTVHGFTHAELGHIRIARAPGDSWPGSCPYHGDCVEGLAAGPAVAARLGMPGAQVGPDHPVWDLVAHALVQLLHTIVFSYAPRRIVIGGGVISAQPQLLAKLRRDLPASLHNYGATGAIADAMETYLVGPALGDMAGPLGAIALASRVHP